MLSTVYRWNYIDLHKVVADLVIVSACEDTNRGILLKVVSSEVLDNDVGPFVGRARKE